MRRPSNFIETEIAITLVHAHGKGIQMEMFEVHLRGLSNENLGLNLQKVDPSKAPSKPRT